MASFSEYIENNGYELLGDPTEPKEGSYARILKVRHIESNEIRAFKVLMRPIVDKKDADYRSFKREFEALQKLSEDGNSHIIHVYRLHEIDNLTFVEMELVDGDDIHSYLQKNGNFVPVEEVLLMVEQISNALALCHRRGIKHNDIHSANIMRRKSGGYVLLDFGLAINTNEAGLTDTRKREGAAEYKAPEKWEEGKEPTTQSDIYSFGIVMYEYLAGEVPFAKEKFSEAELKEKHLNEIPNQISQCREDHYKCINPKASYDRDYPKWLEDVIFKCLEKEPAKRFNDGAELHECIVKNPIKVNGSADGTGTGSETSTEKSGGKRWLIIIALLLLCCIGAYFGFTRKDDPSKVAIKVASSDDNMGIVKGAGTYIQNDTVVIEAVPKERCRFVSWNDGNTERCRKVAVDKDQEYVANFDSIYTDHSSEKKAVAPINNPSGDKKTNQTNSNIATNSSLNSVQGEKSDIKQQYPNRPVRSEIQEDTIIFPYGIYYGEYKIVNGKHYPSGIGMMKYKERHALWSSSNAWHYRYVKAGYELAGIWDGETIRCGTLFDGSATKMVLDSVPCK